MPLSLILACVWSLLAGSLYAAPRRFHWPLAWALIATGIPLLGIMTIQAGPILGLVGLIIAALLLARALGRSAPVQLGDW